MKHTFKTLLICAGMSFSLGAVAAPDVDDITLDVMEHSNDLPDSVKEKIELPEHADDAAHDASEHGTKTANENRHHGKDDDHKDSADDHKDGADDHKDDADDHKEDADEHKEDADDHKEDADEHKEESDDHKDGAMEVKDDADENQAPQ